MENLYYLIPVVAIVGGITYAILSQYWKRRSNTDPRLESALEESVTANREVLARLDSIETRLGAIEKTLNDIPS